jgi:hypothetical protein
MNTKKGFARSALAALLIVVAGCSGGGDSDSASRASPLAGSWDGSATNTTTGEVLHASALIDESGTTQLIVTPAFAGFVGAIPPGVVSVPSLRDPVAGGMIDFPFSVAAATIFVVYGDVCCKTTFEADAGAQSMSMGDKATTRLRGSLSSGMLVGSFDFGGEPYSFSLAPSPIQERGLTLEELAGVYTSQLPVQFGGTVQYTLSIMPNGAISGSHANGCIYNGTVSIPNPSRNLFRLRMQLSNCPGSGLGQRNGDYEGLGQLIRNALVLEPGGVTTTTKQLFYFSLIGPVWLGTQAAER